MIEEIEIETAIAIVDLDQEIESATKGEGEEAPRLGQGLLIN